MKKKIWHLIILNTCILSLFTNAQDPVFSQILINKSYLNPAYAGYSGDLTFDMQSRIQWFRVPSYFLSNAFAINGGCNANRLGFSLQGLSDLRGEGFLQNHRITGAVSVNLPGYTSRKLKNKFLRDRKTIVSTGLAIGIGQRFLNWDRLLFTDQLDHYLGIVRNSSLVNPQNVVSNVIVDLSAGSRMKMEISDKGSNISAGFAMFHINRPIETFFYSENRLPIRYTGHIFLHLQTEKYVNNAQFLTIGWVGNYQQEMQTNIVLLMRDFNSGFMLGGGFRSERIYLLGKTIDSIVLQFNLRQGDVIINYSLDFTVSSLGVHRTFGTHELGISYLMSGYNMCGMFYKRNKRAKTDCFFLYDDLMKKSNFILIQP